MFGRHKQSSTSTAVASALQEQADAIGRAVEDLQAARVKIEKVTKEVRNGIPGSGTRG